MGKNQRLELLGGKRLASNDNGQNRYVNIIKGSDIEQQTVRRKNEVKEM